MAHAIETKVTDWTECKDGPWHHSMSHGGYVAYRVWQQFDGMRWFQRHEWKAANGSTELDAWISGVKGWLPSASELALEAA